ncbi:MAG: retropepsin-like domain-containing protein [Bacteroidales bacterium]|nr:retropepsin-like domain-containing protein [Bacteroidales bacterium]
MEKEIDNFYLDYVAHKASTMTMYAKDRELIALIDTGATYSMISTDLYNSLPEECKISEGEPIKIVMANGDKTIAKQAKLKLQYFNFDTEIEFNVGDWENFSNSTEKAIGLKIDIILGITFFAREKLILDFDKLIVFKRIKEVKQ